jgi:type IV pilus assembly protein PilN
MIRINLLPEEERGRKARRGTPGLKMPAFKLPILPRIPMVPQTIWMIGVIVVLAVVLLLVYAIPKRQIANRNNEIARMEAKLAKLKKEADLVKNLETKEKEMKERLEIITRLNRNRFLRAKMLDDLCSRVPEYLWLTSLEEVSSKVKITGLTFSNLTVARLIEELEESSYFTNPELISLKKKTVVGQDVMEFILETGMKELSAPQTERRRPGRRSG